MTTPRTPGTTLDLHEEIADVVVKLFIDGHAVKDIAQAVNPYGLPSRIEQTIRDYMPPPKAGT